jgi:site-specific DNA-cytosine methylase
MVILRFKLRLTIIYSFHHFEAADYGDPQNRQRLILFVAKKFVRMPNKPVRTHGSIRYCNDNDNAYVDPFVTIGDVFEHLRKPYAKKTYPNMNDCKTTSFKPGESRDVFQLDYNGSSPTMKCASTCLHYAERINSNNNNDDGSNIDIDNDNDDDNFRCINVREYAAIQSFPYDYEFVGKTLTSKYKQAGNAVPVRLAAAIARTIHDSLRYYYQEELLDIDIQ